VVVNTYRSIRSEDHDITAGTDQVHMVHQGAPAQDVTIVGLRFEALHHLDDVDLADSVRGVYVVGIDDEETGDPEFMAELQLDDPGVLGIFNDGQTGLNSRGRAIWAVAPFHVGNAREGRVHIELGTSRKLRRGQRLWVGRREFNPDGDLHNVHTSSTLVVTVLE